MGAISNGLEIIKIEATDDTPFVLLDPRNGKIEIGGHSLPEDVKEFYTPIMNWILAYKDNPNENTHVVFKFDYFNTASSKQILDMIEEIKQIKQNGNQLKVDWFYMEDDDDMLDAGEQFAEFTELEFSFHILPEE